MKLGRLLLGAGVALSLSPLESRAGPCTDQIHDVQKIIASTDAGSGPTMKTGSTNTIGTPPAVSGAANAGSAVPATPREVPPAGVAPKTEATAAMNAATQNIATSPQDARSQTQGQPTASQVASGAAPKQDRLKEADGLLVRARAADQAGDASGCTNAVSELRKLLGTP